MLILAGIALARVLEMQFPFLETTACSRLRQEQSLWHKGYNTEAEETYTCFSNLLLGNLNAF